MTRSHRRPAAPAVAAALAVATGLLAACSAGQLAATSLVVPAVPGAQAAVKVAVKPGSAPQTIQISNATVDFPGAKGYRPGDNAPLSVWIFNNTEQDITLTGVTSDYGTVLLSTGTHAGAASACNSSARPLDVNPSTGAPTAGVGPSPGASGNVSPAGPTGTPTGRPSPPPTASAAPSPSPSASPSATPAGSATINVRVKAFGCVALNRDGARFLQVTQLSHAVGSGMTVPVRFSFVQSGGAQYTIPQDRSSLAVPVDVPSSPGSRAPAQVPGGAGE